MKTNTERTSSKSTPISSSESEPPSMVKSIAVSLILAVGQKQKEGGREEGGGRVREMSA